jgi:hypothetical protein
MPADEPQKMQAAEYAGQADALKTQMGRHASVSSRTLVGHYALPRPASI